MSVWAVAVIDDARLSALSTELADLLDEYHRTEAFARYVELMAWWEHGGDAEDFFEPVPGRSWLRPTAAAERFATLIDVANPGSQTYGDLAERFVELMPHGGKGTFAATARKASPAAALHYGLGAARSALLPGRFGEFALTHTDVAAALADVEQALALTGQCRSQVLERSRRWLAEYGDAPEADAEELLDGPLRVLRLATATGQGAVGVVAWY